MPSSIPRPRTSRASAALRVLRASAAAAIVGLAGCQVVPTPPPGVQPAAPPHAVYSRASFDALPAWKDDDPAAAWPALLESCNALVARPATEPVWSGVCAAAAAVDARDAGAVRSFFESHFTPWRVSGSDGSASGLITGYYEPLLSGSRTRTATCATPLYAPPDDLLTVDLAGLYPELKGKRVRGRLDGRRVVPYWTRADIDAGRVGATATVLVWVTDPVDAFFLQVQGSGRIELADGGVMRVGYADQNGQPYRSIARVLVDRGEMTVDQASMQSIREWGIEHPDRIKALLDENPSYVFFRILPPPAPG